VFGEAAEDGSTPRSVHVNATAARLFGRGAEELLGASDPPGIGAGSDDVRALRAVLRHLLIDPKAPRRTGSLGLVRRDGHRLRLEYSASSTASPAGRRFVLVLREMGSRGEPPGAAHRWEAAWNALLEAFPDAVAVARDGLVTYANPALRRLLGSGAAVDVDGRSVSELIESLVHRDDRARIAAYHDELVSLVSSVHSPGPRPSVEVRLIRAGVPFAYAAVFGVPMGSAGDGAILFVVRDITEQKKIQAKLALSDRMASVGTLAAGVAHEINNPLSYVTLNLEMLAEELRNFETWQFRADRIPKLSAMVRDARQGAERVRKIVRELKTLSRADEEHRVAIDVRGVIEGSISVASNEIKHRARVRREYGPAPNVLADEARLGQVFINLVVNAAQSIPEGHVEKNEIRIVTATDGAGRAVIEVRDTGRGIPPEILDRIFDPFFTTKPMGEGTGLGLALCQSIISALDGEIAVESTLGRGTVFRVTLPPALTDVGKTASQRPAGPPPREEARGRILVIDDDAMIGSLLERVLSEEHELTLVTEGQRAIDLFAEGRLFDVILCDLMMPEMTGMDIHGFLLGHAPDQAERMIFITGGAFTATAKAFLDGVLNERLDKPFGAEQVRTLVRRFLTRTTT
jgi:PAS domain S-box-containing protein